MVYRSKKRRLELKKKLSDLRKGKRFGKENPNWKGDKVGYSGLHKWVSRHFGKPKECEKCGRTGHRIVQWANKTGKYLRERKDWFVLCASCHKLYDLNRK